VQQPEASELRSRHTVPGELATWLLFIIVQAPRTGTAINIDEGAGQLSRGRRMRIGKPFVSFFSFKKSADFLICI